MVSLSEPHARAPHLRAEPLKRMTPPPTLAGRLLETAWFASPARRRLTFAAVALALAGLSFYPRNYAAEAELMPQAAGLSAALAQTGADAILGLNAFSGTRQPIEADLAVARSHAVSTLIIDRLHLASADPEARRRVEARLDRKLNVIAIRDSVLRITFEDRDPAMARAVTAAAAQALSDRLAQIGDEEAQARRVLLSDRLAEAARRLSKAKQDSGTGTDLAGAQALYDSYAHDLQQLPAQDLSASHSLAVIEPAYVKPERQLNMWAAALLMLTLMIAAGLELYRVRPPLGAARVSDGS